MPGGLNAKRRAATGAVANRENERSGVRLDSTPDSPFGQSPDFPIDPISVYPVALAFLDWGCSLVPLKENSKWIRYGFGPMQKHVTNYGDAYHQFVTLRSNIGILTGGERGLTILDCDGEQVYQNLVERWPVLAQTFTVRTATPGHCHVYVLAGDLPSGVVEGIEVKSRGKVVVGPASVVDGRRYTPLDWQAPIIRIIPADFSFFSALTIKADVPLKKEKDPIGNDLVARLKKAWSLVEICESHGIKLTGAGRLRRALCPFHSETIASFTIDLERGLWRCFGCERHGDVINLMAMMENMTVSEAIRIMAQRLPSAAVARSLLLIKENCRLRGDSDQ